MLKRTRKTLRPLRLVLRSVWRTLLHALRRGPPVYAFDIPTHLTDAEKIALFETARRLPNRCIGLEVGSYVGASACILGFAIQQKVGKLHCVDTWTNVAMDEPERDTWSEFAKNTSAFRDAIVPHKGLSVDIAEKLSISLDLLFIDGDHSEEAVDADLRAWLPKLKPGGIIVMHDIGWSRGVQQAVNCHLRTKVVTEIELPNLLICRLAKSGASAGEREPT